MVCGSQKIKLSVTFCTWTRMRFPAIFNDLFCSGVYLRPEAKVPPLLQQQSSLIDDDKKFNSCTKSNGDCSGMFLNPKHQAAIWRHSMEHCLHFSAHSRQWAASCRAHSSPQAVQKSAHNLHISLALLLPRLISSAAA